MIGYSYKEYDIIRYMIKRKCDKYVDEIKDFYRKKGGHIFEARGCVTLDFELKFRSVVLTIT